MNEWAGVNEVWVGMVHQGGVFNVVAKGAEEEVMKRDASLSMLGEVLKATSEGLSEDISGIVCLDFRPLRFPLVVFRVGVVIEKGVVMF